MLIPVQVANTVQKHVRRSRDHLARYGGKEFLVMLPGMSENEALLVADRVRKSVEAAAMLNPTSRVSRYVTLSIGVAVQGTADEVVSWTQLQRNAGAEAEAALYQAKQSVRNRVVIYRPVTSNIRNDRRHDNTAERTVIR